MRKAIFLLLFVFILNLINFKTVFAVEKYCLGPWRTVASGVSSGGQSAGACSGYVSGLNSRATKIMGYPLTRHSVYTYSPHCTIRQENRDVVLPPGIINTATEKIFCPPLDSVMKLEVGGASPVLGTENAYRISKFGSFTVSWEAPFAIRCKLSADKTPFDRPFGGEFSGQSSFIRGSETFRDVKEGVYTFTFECGGYENNEVSPEPDFLITRNVSVFSGSVPYPSLNVVIEPKEIKRGELAKIIWSSVNAEGVTINGKTVSASGDAGINTLFPLTTNTARTHTFKVEARGRFGLPSAITEITLTVLSVPPPAVLKFETDRTSIEIGKSAFLTWKTENAGSISIDADLGPDPAVSSQQLSGSVKVTPSDTTRYTITAFRKFPEHRDATASTTLEVKFPELKIFDFTATLTSILIGEKSTLSWATENITALSISDARGVVRSGLNPSGTLDVSPEATTTYILSGTGRYPQSGFAQERETVNVSAPKLKILEFTADRPLPITRGQEIALSWRTKNVTQLFRQEKSGALTPLENPASGFMTVTPDATTEYTLVGRGKYEASGEVQKKLLVTVGEYPRPKVRFFKIDPLFVTKGEKQDVTLTWRTEYANRIQITICSKTVNPICRNISVLNKKPANDSVTIVQPDETSTLTITAFSQYKDLGSDDLSWDLPVNLPPKPVIKSFEALPLGGEILKGNPATLKWNVENATRVIIEDGDGKLITSKDPRTITEFEVRPTSRTQYFLTAQGQYETVEAGPVTVNVNLPPKPIISSFNPNPQTIIRGQVPKVKLEWKVENASTVDIIDKNRNFVLAEDLDPKIGQLEIDSPIADNIYTLVAYPLSPDLRPERLDTKLIVNLPRVIADFTSDSPLITRGDWVTLKWKTENAASISIKDNTGRRIGLGLDLPLASGELRDRPTTDVTSYIITVGGEFGQRPIQKSVSIKVRPPQTPTITLLELSPQKIIRRQKAILKWESVNASTIKIVDDRGRAVGRNLNPQKGEVEVGPSVDTEYTLTVGGAVVEAPSDEESITLSVRPPPPEVIFKAEPTAIIKGEQSAILKWETKNVSSVTIRDGAGRSVGFGLDSRMDEVEVSPDSTTKYTLIAKGEAEELRKDVVLIVNLPGAPQIVSFKADPVSIVRGERRALLKWETKNAVAVNIKTDKGAPVGDNLGPAGEIEVEPIATTIYKITATSRFPKELPDAQETTELRVALPGGPRVTTFKVEPESVVRPKGAVLSWVTEAASSVSIEPGIGKVALSGSREVFPATTTEYMVIAVGKFDQTDKRTATVGVTLPGAPRIISFKVEPEKIKKRESATLSWATENVVSLTMNPGIGMVKANGSIKVSPSFTTRYTLTASGKFAEQGLDRKSVTLNVESPILVPVEEAPEEIIEEKPPEDIKPTERPTLDLKVNGEDGPLTMNAPAKFTLSWNLDRYCIAYGSWFGVKTKAAPDMRTQTRPGSYTYRLYCPLVGTDEVIVNVVGTGGGAGTGPGEAEVGLPVAEASISLDGQNFSKSISVIRGEPVEVWLSAAFDTDNDGKVSRDANGEWGSSLSFGGRCEWNSDLNQGTAVFDERISDPENSEDCTINIGELKFFDQPGKYNYEALRLIQRDGKVSNTASVEIEVKEPPLPPGPPEIDLKINDLGGQVILGAPADYNVSWNVKNADSCTASGSWGGDKFISGLQRFVSSEKNDFIYTLTCTGKLGTTSESISLKVAELPVCDFSALPTVVSKSSFERQSVLSWKCQFANTCSISPSVDIEGKTFGSTRVSPTETTNYTLTCQNLDGSSSFDAAVEVR